jgi:hypothetical protein
MNHAESPKGLTEVLAKRRIHHFARLRKMSEEQGKVMFDGRLLDPEEAQERFRRMKRLDRVVFAEIVLLIVLLAGGAALLGLILLLLSG